MLTLLEFALQNLLFIGLHLDSRSSFPKQLTQKEEEECIALIAQGDMEARGRLIVHNLRLVAYIVNKNYPEAVRGCQQDAGDLISIGTIGLIRAAETFDYTKGRRFSTYASRCIDKPITSPRKLMVSPAVFAIFRYYYRVQGRCEPFLRPILCGRLFCA